MRKKLTCKQWRMQVVAIGMIAVFAAISHVPPIRTSHAAEFDLEMALRPIAARGAEEVAFEERRFLGVVTEPLESSGTLRFEPPDRLIKKTGAPFRETAIVDKDRLTVLDGNGVETLSISLWASEELRLVFDSLRAVLRGDAAALRTLFDVSVSGSETEWTISLMPKAAQDEGHIAEIIVWGVSGRIVSFDIRETNGDRALIRLTGSVERS